MRTIMHAHSLSFFFSFFFGGGGGGGALARKNPAYVFFPIQRHIMHHGLFPSGNWLYSHFFGGGGVVDGRREDNYTLTDSSIVINYLSSIFSV